MSDQEFHKELSESINKNRERLRKLKKALFYGRLSEEDKLKYQHAVIRLTEKLKKMVRHEINFFGGPYSESRYK